MPEVPETASFEEMGFAPKSAYKFTQVDIPKYGTAAAKIWMRHDQWMGKAVIHENLNVYRQVTPNMPKLPYCLDPESLELIDELKEFSGIAVFDVKRDGFNVLFYPIYGKDGGQVVVPKTRMSVIAKGRILNVLKEMPEDLKEKIEKMVADGYVPVFEVWGSKLEDYKVLTGITNKEATEKVEGLPYGLHFELTHMFRLAKYFEEWDDYEGLSPVQRQKIAREYGVKTVPQYVVLKVDRGEIKEYVYVGDLHDVKIPETRDLKEFMIQLMHEFDRVNEEHGVITEGAVVHFGPNMCKLKAFEVMKHDIQRAKGVASIDRIEAEYSKVALEVPTMEIARRYEEIAEEIVKYIEEDFRLTKEGVKHVWNVVKDRVSTDLILETYGGEEIGEYLRALAEGGVDSKVIACVARKVRACKLAEDFEECVKEVKCF